MSRMLWLIALIIPIVANADSCRRITNTINNDLTKYNGQIKNRNLPWMNFIWLKQQLGREDVKRISDDKTKYKWRCGPDGSFLVAVVDNDGNLLRISGQYNSDEGSGLFATKIPKTDRLMLADADAGASDAQRMDIPEPHDRYTNYNHHFKTNFQSATEIENDLVARIKYYYANLRLCQPGTYEYALPSVRNLLYHKAVIQPQKDGKCPVKISWVIPEIGNIDLKCNFEMQNLLLFNDSEAEIAAHGTNQASNENPSLLQTTINRECKRYIDGVP